MSCILFFRSYQVAQSSIKCGSIYYGIKIQSGTVWGIFLSAVHQYYIPYKDFEAIHVYPDNHVYLIAASAVCLSAQRSAAHVISL